MNSISPKICTNCKEEKTFDSLGKNKREKDGHHYYCQGCVKHINESNKEQKRVYFKKYREKNREKLKEYPKQRRLTYLTADDFDHEITIEKKQAKRERKKKDDKIPSIKSVGSFTSKINIRLMFSLNLRSSLKRNLINS